MHNWWKKSIQGSEVKSERGKPNVASWSSAEVYVADNSTTDGFWRTTSKLFLLQKLAHVLDGGHNDGRSGGDGTGGAGDDVCSENIESHGINVTHTV